MSVQRGRNRAGLTGIIDLPNLGTGVEFHADIYRWQKRLAGATRPRAGRGSTRFETVRWTFSSGTGACSGKLTLSDWPAPSAWYGQAGTITVQADTGKTIAYPVLVTGFDVSFDVDKTDGPGNVSLAYQITGDPVYTGWAAGQQPAPVDPTKADQEQYAGTSKTSDPNSLQSAATRVIDVWGTLDDTDAAELTKLTTVISAASAPFAGMKLRNAVFVRDAIDGATITQTWGLTDTQDDVEMPQSPTNDDVDEIDSTAAICEVTASSTLPTIPTAPLGEHVHSDSLQLNDGRWQHIFRYANTGSAARLAYPESPIDADASLIKDTDQQSSITTSSTPPTTPTPRIADLQLRRRTSTRVTSTPEQWQHTFYFARNTVANDIEIEGELETVDPDTIGQTAVIRHVTSSSTPPAADAAPTGQLIETKTEPLTVQNGAYTGYWVHTFTYGPTTKKQAAQEQGTTLSADPALQNDDDVQTLVNSSSAPPTTPTARIANQVLVLRVSRQTQDTPQIWEHRFQFGYRSSTDALIAEKAQTNTDPGAIDDDVFTATVYTGVAPADPTAPSGLQLLSRLDVSTKNPLYTLRIYHWTRNSSQQKRTFPQIATVIDTQSIADQSKRSEFWNVGDTPPATPTDAPANNVKLVNTTDIPITPQLNQRVWEYGAHDSADKLKLGSHRFRTNYDTQTDPTNVEPSAFRSYMDGDTQPANPDPTNLVLRSSRSLPQSFGLGTNRTLNLDEYGPRTAQQDIEFEQSRSTAEAGALEQREVVTKVTSSPTPDATGLNPDTTNLELYWSESHRINQTLYAHLYDFRPLNPTDRMAAEFQRDEIDPAAIDDLHTRVLYGTTSTPSADPGVPGMVLTRTEVKRVGLAKYRYVYTYDYRDAADKLVADRTRTLTDLSGIESEAYTAAVFTGTAPADPTNAGFVLLSRLDLPTRNPTYTLRVYRWGLVTPQQRLEYEATRAEADPLDVYRRETASFVAWTGTASALADSLLSGNRTDLTFDGASARLITPAKALQVIRTTGEDKKIHSMVGRTAWEPLRGVPTGGFGSSNANILIKAPGPVVGGPGGFTWGTVIPVQILRSRGRFSLRRRFICTDITNGVQNKMNLAIMGQVNDAQFLAWAAHEVMYSYPEIIYQMALEDGTGHLIVMDYVFETDNQMFVSDAYMPTGKVYVNSTSSLVTTTAFYPNSAFSSALGVVWPTASSFAGFLT